MTARLYALLRLLACQRAQVLLDPIAERFVAAWESALETGHPLPDPLDFIREASLAGVQLHAPGPFMGYVEACQAGHRLPLSRRLVMAYVHGLGEKRHFTGQRNCRCPVRRPFTP